MTSTSSKNISEKSGLEARLQHSDSDTEDWTSRIQAKLGSTTPLAAALGIPGQAGACSDGVGTQRQPSAGACPLNASRAGGSHVPIRAAMHFPTSGCVRQAAKLLPVRLIQHVRLRAALFHRCINLVAPGTHGQRAGCSVIERRSR